MTETLVGRILPLNLLGLAVATCVFWALSKRDLQVDPSEAGAVLAPEFRVNFFKAIIPVLPLILLFLTGPPLKLLQVPPGWLLEQKQQELPGAIPASAEPSLSPQERGLFDCRLIGAAMLVGVVVATLSAGRKGLQVAGTFFDGAGYAFTHIISLIVTANCFGEAVKLIGLARLLGDLIEMAPVLLMPAAGLLPLAFATLCGSGMATTQSLFGFFARPALQLEIDPFLVGAIVSLASAAGRTVSPFSAVTLMCGTLTKNTAMQLSMRVAPPLLAAIVVEVIAAMLL